MSDDKLKFEESDGKIGDNDAALIMQPDGRIRVILPGRDDPQGHNDELQPHVSMIAGMFLAMKDGTPESRDFLNHCVEHINKSYGDPI